MFTLAPWGSWNWSHSHSSMGWVLGEIRVGIPGEVQAEQQSRECKVFQSLNLQTEGIKL